MKVESFPPSVSSRCRALVLGSAPSVRSLERGQYYGHPQNLFWPFIQELFGVPASAPYQQRLAALRGHGIAVWDVAHRCQRELSADATINAVEANDFAGLFAEYPRIKSVFFNGSKAHTLFDKLVLPEFDAAGLHFTRLPSTSPANASIPRTERLLRWRSLTLGV